MAFVCGSKFVRFFVILSMEKRIIEKIPILSYFTLVIRWFFLNGIINNRFNFKYLKNGPHRFYTGACRISAIRFSLTAAVMTNNKSAQLVKYPLLVNYGKKCIGKPCEFTLIQPSLLSIFQILRVVYFLEEMLLSCCI